jgi:hypothetical protein
MVSRALRLARVAAVDQQAVLFGLNAVGQGAQVIHLRLPGAAEHHGMQLVGAITQAALLDPLLEKLKALIEQGAHLYGVVLLHGVIGGDGLEVIDLRWQLGNGLGIRHEVGVFVGDQEAAAAGLGVLRRAHDPLHLTDHLKGMLHPVLTRQQDVHGTEGQPRIHGDDGDSAKE